MWNIKNYVKLVIRGVEVYSNSSDERLIKTTASHALATITLKANKEGKKNTKVKEKYLINTLVKKQLKSKE